LALDVTYLRQHHHCETYKEQQK